MMIPKEAGRSFGQMGWRALSLNTVLVSIDGLTGFCLGSGDVAGLATWKLPIRKCLVVNLLIQVHGVL